MTAQHIFGHLLMVCGAVGLLADLLNARDARQQARDDAADRAGMGSSFNHFGGML